MNEWRVILDIPRPGSKGLAFDEALLRSISAGHAPNTLKIYYFDPPTVVLGIHQAVSDVNLNYILRTGFDLNRRLTGGGAILLGLPSAKSQMGITIISQNNAELPATLRGKFEYFTPIIVNALNALDLHTKIAGNYDITVGGRKVVGCGIYAEDNAVLFHAMILLDCDYAATVKIVNFPNNTPVDVILQNMQKKVTTLREKLNEISGIKKLETILIKKLSAIMNTPVNIGNYTSDEINECESLLKSKYASQEWIFGNPGDAASIGACFVPAPQSRTHDTEKFEPI